MTGHSLTQDPPLDRTVADAHAAGAPSADGRIWRGMTRGVAGRCPNCGQGKLYRAYLKVQPCPACGHENPQYPADDAGPYFTILLIGHLVIAPLLVFSFIWKAPTAWVLAITLPSVAILTLLALPRVKGAIIGLHWALKCKGDPSREPL
ncbi:MAG TPA: DUF983 domain-containing protein [Caulobacteraceae bacterium]|nr:DUF983 domain-containing protein [Caulobacteraceae bacterium]